VNALFHPVVARQAAASAVFAARRNCNTTISLANDAQQERRKSCTKLAKRRFGGLAHQPLPPTFNPFPDNTRLLCC
jgi:hypothetical protein